MRRGLGLTGLNLDGPVFVLDTNDLGVGQSREFERVEVAEVFRLLGKHRPFMQSLHQERVVFAKKEPLEVV